MRLHFLDNIKAALIALVVVHHAGQAYGPTDYWPIRSEEQIALLGPFFEINGAFFMGLFFMISAYFLPVSTDRKGPVPVLKDRFMRLGIPLLFMTLIIFGPITYVVDEIPGSFWNYMVFQYIGTGDLELAHLWFIALLLCFSICYVVFRLLAPSGTEQSPAIASQSAPGNGLLLGLTLGLLLSNAVIRIWFPVGGWVDVLPILPVEVGRLPQYAGLFVIGLIACRKGWLLMMPRRQALLWFGLAMTAAVSVYINAATGWWPEQVWLVQEAVMGIGFCFSLPVLARELWNQSGPFMQRMADNAFAVYLVHIIIIYVLQEAMETTGLGAGARFMVVAVLGLVLSFAVADGLRRIRPLRRFL